MTTTVTSNNDRINHYPIYTDDFIQFLEANRQTPFILKSQTECPLAVFLADKYQGGSDEFCVCVHNKKYEIKDDGYYAERKLPDWCVTFVKIADAFYDKKEPFNGAQCLVIMSAIKDIISLFH